MQSVRTCPVCDAPLPSDVPEGPCSKCSAAAQSETPTLLTTAPPSAAADSPVGLGVVRYFGDYELLQEIARGGMGIVYQARQVSLNRIVALKMILAGRLASEPEVKRFRTEAEAAANLQHPNIVAIHEVGEHEGHHYFSMDYVDGHNLGLMIKQGPMPAIKAAELVKTLADALQFAHQRGILHRDLKPHNILIDSRGTPRITDFGLAKRFDQDSSLTMEGAVMGSPSYMSPEQAASRQDLLGPPTDVYSLGAILYELLTGRPPFQGRTAIETMRQVIDQNPARLSDLNAKIPADLETICLKALEKKPEHRYNSARALAEELARFLNREPILARPAGYLRKAGAWFQRHPWMITAGLAVVVLALFALAFGFWDKSRYLEWLQTHQPPKKRPEGKWFFVSLLAMAPLSLLIVPFAFLDFVDRKRRGFPLLARHLQVYTLFATVALGLSINFTMSLVHESIWRGDSTFRDALAAILVFPGAWLGSLLLWHVIKEYRSLEFGLERADAAVLFPPKPKEAWKVPPSTIGARQGFNLVGLAFVVAASVGSLASRLVASSPEGHSIFGMIGFSAAAAWFFLAWWRKTRSASRHVILLFGLFQLMSVGFVFFASSDSNLQAAFRIPGARWLALGLGLATGLLVGQLAGKAKTLKDADATLEVADYPWTRAHRGLFLFMLAFVFLVLPPHLGFFFFILLLETAPFLRARGLERRVRGQSLILWFLACLLTLVGDFSFDRVIREILVGAILAFFMLAFMVWRSKRSA